jgi:hypothetical protein
MREVIVTGSGSLNVIRLPAAGSSRCGVTRRGSANVLNAF